MSDSTGIRVMMFGFRGFPGVQGGIEAHAEQLCPRLVGLGCDLEVVVRSAYVSSEVTDEWRGVRFRRLWCPRSRALESIVHTFLAVLYAARARPDLVHIHGIGPALVTPLARLLGLGVVVTHHGPDYEREKWGWLAKQVLRLGELMGMRFSNARIAISKVIATAVYSRFGVASTVIPNGVTLPRIPSTTKGLEAFGLVAERYVLIVSRIVEEKRHCDLIDAFSRAGLSGWQLAIVGVADHPGAYSQRVEELAARVPGVILTGFQYGDVLQQLFAHAGIFVLPSSHEGHPIALLEALSYGLPCLASDIPAHREVGLAPSQYFPLGNIEALAGKLRNAMENKRTFSDLERVRDWVSGRYDWNAFAKKTLDVYRTVAIRR